MARLSRVRNWVGKTAVAGAGILLLGVSTVRAGGRQFVLQWTSGCDSNLAARVASFCSSELEHVPVVLTTCRDAGPKAVGAPEGRRCPIDTNAIASVCLVKGTNPTGTVVTVKSNACVGVVDIASAGLGADIAPESYARWVERNTMRAFGLLVGVKVCPNPQCAMSAYQVKANTLSVLGRNYCPVCRKSFRERVEQMGVELPKAQRRAPAPKK